jgi:hypothetical protein
VYHFVSGGLIFWTLWLLRLIYDEPLIKNPPSTTQLERVLSSKQAAVLVEIMVYFPPHFTGIDDGVDTSENFKVEATLDRNKNIYVTHSSFLSTPSIPHYV